MIDINHIADLARLGLTEQEKKKFTKEIEAILDFIASLNEVNTDKIEPMSHASGMQNRYREDANPLEGGVYSERLLEAAPYKEKGFVKVKTVLEK